MKLSPNLSMQGPKIIHILLLLARRLSSLRSSVGQTGMVKSEKPAQAGQLPVRYNLSRVTRTDPCTCPPEAETAKV